MFTICQEPTLNVPKETLLKSLLIYYGKLLCSGYPPNLVNASKI